MINLNFLLRDKLCRLILPALAITAIIIAHFVVFAIVPDERVMGPVQRIFYFHVGAAMTVYAMVAVLFFASVFYLGSKRWEWDSLASAAASVGLLFSTIVLATGMIWGHSAWNTWWRWEPRLVSFLVLWLILLSYVLLRDFTAGNDRQRSFMAILGVLAAVNVPIVIFSVKLLDHSEQLHPEVVANQGLRDLRFVYGLIAGNIATILLGVWLAVIKLTNVLLLRECSLLRR